MVKGTERRASDFILAFWGTFGVDASGARAFGVASLGVSAPYLG